VKVTEAFRDAEALADFANLEPTDLATVANFRKNYPDFAPDEWWDYPYRIDGTRVIRAEDVDKIRNDPDYKTQFDKLGEGLPQWQHAQDHIQEVWKAKFKLNASGVSDLLKLVFYVDRPGLVWNSSQVLLPNGTIYELNTKLYSFHKAVLYLHERPGQAKVCTECGKYFVTARGKRELCLFPDSRGETCAQKRINERKSKWWHDHGTKRRRAKRNRMNTKARKQSTHRGVRNA